MHHFENLESAVIGCLISIGVVDDKTAGVLEVLKPEHFYLHVNRVIYSRIKLNSSDNKPFDLLNIDADLSRNKSDYDEIGGFAYLAEIVDLGYSQSSLELSTAKIIQAYTARNLEAKIVSAQEKLNSGFDLTESMANALSELSTIEVDQDKSGLTHIKDTLAGFINVTERAFKGGGVIGYQTGFSALDENIGGFDSGDLIVVAGKPSSGKTTLAMNLMRSAIQANDNCLIFSLEMTQSQLNQKLVADYENIPLTDIRNGSILGDDLYAARLGKYIQAMQKTNLHIDDTPALHIDTLVARARKHKIKHGKVSLVMVDYIQIVKSSAKERYMQVSDVSMKLKALAKELDCPVIALSQLAKNLVGRPSGSWLRESGQIEQDADIILFIHTDNDDNKPIDGQLTELIRNKVRMGQVGVSCLTPQLKYQRFVCAGV